MDYRGSHKSSSAIQASGIESGPDRRVGDPATGRSICGAGIVGDGAICCTLVQSPFVGPLLSDDSQHRLLAILKQRNDRTALLLACSAKRCFEYV